MLSEDLLKLLVCPMGKAPLVREGESLVCSRCGTQFAINEDIPNMLIEEAQLPSGCGSLSELDCAQERGREDRYRMRSRSSAGRRGVARSLDGLARRDAGQTIAQRHTPADLPLPGVTLGQLAAPAFGLGRVRQRLPPVTASRDGREKGIELSGGRRIDYRGGYSAPARGGRRR